MKNSLLAILFTTALVIIFIATPAFADSDYIVTGSGSSTIVISDAGDIDGDGIDDVLVGEPEFGDDDSLEGRVSLFFGKNIEDGELDLNFADAIIPGDFDGEQLGSQVGFTDDQDGDGFDDITIGSKLESDIIITLSELADYQPQTVAANEAQASQARVSVAISQDTGCSLNPDSNNRSGLGFLSLILSILFFLLSLRAIVQVTQTRHQHED